AYRLTRARMRPGAVGARLLRQPQLRVCLLQPEPHAHLAVHRRGDGEVLVRVLALGRAPVELAEAEVAVSDEGARAELQSECHGVAVVALSDPGRVTMRGEFAEEMTHPRLAAPGLLCAREFKLVRNEISRVVHATGQETALGQHAGRRNLGWVFSRSRE